MRIIIQRVNSAKVSVEGKTLAQIKNGMLVLLGIGQEDEKNDAEKLAIKLLKMRIMKDGVGKMNLSVSDVKGSILVVSQFTLYADTSDGNRPSFIRAKEPAEAEKLYLYFLDLLKKSSVNVQNGEFGSYMKIQTELDGPVTIILESQNLK